MRRALLRSYALMHPLLELPVDLVEPGDLLRIENFPDPVAGLLMEGLELRSAPLLQLLMLFFRILHDLAELLGLRVREAQLPRQATDHTAPRWSPSVQHARVPTIIEHAAAADNDTQKKRQGEIDVSAARHLGFALLPSVGPERPGAKSLDASSAKRGSLAVAAATSSPAK